MATKKTAPKSEPTVDASSHSAIPGVNDLLGLLGGANPLMALGRMVETVMQVTGDMQIRFYKKSLSPEFS